MHNVIIDYFPHKHDDREFSYTCVEPFSTLEEALERYKEANWAACRQPGSDIKRITIRTNDGTTIKTFSFPN